MATSQQPVSFPRDLADEYERLRATALESSRPHGSVAGLAIFLRKGMATWMHAYASVTPPSSVPTMLDARMLPSVQRDVVDVLTTIVLTITSEVTA